MNNYFLKTVFAALFPLCVYAADTNAAQSSTPFIEYHNRMSVFGPLHQVYERIKTDAFYVGVEAWAAPSFQRSKTVIGEAELRMGYNFFWNKRDHFTPVVGGGVFKDFREFHSYSWEWDEFGYFHHHHSKHRLPTVGYGTVGFLYDHEFNSVFNLGLNLKGIIGGAKSKKDFNWGSPILGIDAALPITFRFGHKRHWDYRIELFNIYLHGSDIHANYSGFRNTIGYRF